MKLKYFLLAIGVFASAMPGQNACASEFGEILVSANRNNASYAQENRPLIGLRRQADSIVLQISISSDSRDAEIRKKEIHAVLLGAIESASAANIELVTGNFELRPVSRLNYQKLALYTGDRVDTNRVQVMLKAKLNGTVDAARVKLDSFVKSIPKSGRGVVDPVGGTTLTIISPDQYRDDIIKLVADYARKQAGVFGPDYAVQVTGIDGQVAWSQVSDSEVFLYMPYRFTILPK